MSSILHCALAAVHMYSRTFCTSLSRSAHDLSLFCTSSANRGLQLKTSTQSSRLWEGEVRGGEGRGGEGKTGEGKRGEGRGGEERGGEGRGGEGKRGEGREGEGRGREGRGGEGRGGKGRGGEEREGEGRGRERRGGPLPWITLHAYSSSMQCNTYEIYHIPVTNKNKQTNMEHTTATLNNKFIQKQITQ